MGKLIKVCFVVGLGWGTGLAIDGKGAFVTALIAIYFGWNYLALEEKTKDIYTEEKCNSSYTNSDVTVEGNDTIPTIQPPPIGTYEKKVECPIPQYLWNVNQHPFYLNVRYEEKTVAKWHNAKWNPIIKKWYSTNRFEYPLLKRWAPNNYVIYDSLYILKAPRKCPRCKKTITVIAFAVERYCDMTQEPIVANMDCLVVVSEITPMPLWLQSLVGGYGYHYDKKKYRNHCVHCGYTQGKYHLHDEVDGPFLFPTNRTDITWHKIILKEDICVNMQYDIVCGLGDIPKAQIAIEMTQEFTWDEKHKI